MKDVVYALNGFYDEFLEQNIRINIDHANQEDINDGEYNKQNASRVFKLHLSIYTCPFRPSYSVCFVARSRFLDFLEQSILKT